MERDDSGQALDLTPNARLFSYRRRFGGVNDFSGLASTNPETRSLSRWLPKLSGIAGHATHELRTSTKNSSSVRHDGRRCKQKRWRESVKNCGENHFGALRKISTRPSATCLAREISEGSKEMAATRW